MRPARILVRAPSWIGDAVMATPALRAFSCASAMRSGSMSTHTARAPSFAAAK